MTSYNLINVCEQYFETLPPSRNNNQAIDHMLVTSGILPHIKSAGLVPKEIEFSTSDHQTLFLDLHPKVLGTKNIPLQPASTRKLKIHNAPKVESRRP